MGLALRINLFYGVPHQKVYRTYTQFYDKWNQHFENEGDDGYQFRLHELENNWVLLDLDGGWEWKVRREAQLYVSEQLHCSGLLLFVYDGSFWGYELFHNGKVLNHFIQDADAAQSTSWFPGSPCTGNPEKLAEAIPHLSSADISPYLIRNPMWEDWQEWEDLSDEQRKVETIRRWNMRDQLNVPVKPEDEFCRFDECAIVDFLRLLGVRVQLQPCPEQPSVRCVTFLSPLYRSFWISEQNTCLAHRERYPR